MSDPSATNDVVEVLYKNWKGSIDYRLIRPIRLFWGATEHHPEEQWLLRCFDTEKQAERTFAMSGISAWAKPGAREMYQW